MNLEKLTTEAGPASSLADETGFGEKTRAAMPPSARVFGGNSLNKLSSSACISGNSLMQSKPPDSNSLPPRDTGLSTLLLSVDNSNGSKTPGQKERNPKVQW